MKGKHTVPCHLVRCSQIGTGWYCLFHDSCFICLIHSGDLQYYLLVQLILSVLGFVHFCYLSTESFLTMFYSVLVCGIQCTIKLNCINSYYKIQHFIHACS